MFRVFFNRIEYPEADTFIFKRKISYHHLVSHPSNGSP
jgi:hypothetical protein